MGGVLGVVGSVIGGIGQSRAANSARDAQLGALNRANDQAVDWRNQLQGMYNPYQNLGFGATQALQSLAFNPSYWGGYGGFNSTAGQAAPSLGGFMQQQPTAQPQQGQVPLQGGGFAQRPGTQYQSPEPIQGGFNPAPMEMNAAGPMSGLGSPRGAGMQTGGPAMGQPVSDDPRFAMGGLGTTEMPGGGMGAAPDGMHRGAGMQEGGPARPGLSGGGSIQPVETRMPPTGGFNPQLPMTPGANVTPPASTGPNWGGAYANSYYGQAAGMPGDINANIAAGNKSWTPQEVIDDPGYGFAMKAAQDAMGQQMAAQGSSGSGGAARYAGDVAGQVASKYYGDAWNRMQQDRGFWAGRADQAFNQDMMKAQFGLGAGQQGFNQWLQAQGLGLQRDQLGWQQTTGNRDYDMALRNQQLGLLGSLSGLGFNALNQYAGQGTGIQQGIGSNIVGMGNAQSASEAAKGQAWGNFGNTLGNIGSFGVGNDLFGMWGMQPKGKG